jgi:hypothetical protein
MKTRFLIASLLALSGIITPISLVAAQSQANGSLCF